MGGRDSAVPRAQCCGLTLSTLFADYVYFENSSSNPYLIRRIEELNKVGCARVPSLESWSVGSLWPCKRVCSAGPSAGHERPESVWVGRPVGSSWWGVPCPPAASFPLTEAPSSPSLQACRASPTQRCEPLATLPTSPAGLLIGGLPGSAGGEAGVSCIGHRGPGSTESQGLLWPLLRESSCCP